MTAPSDPSWGPQQGEALKKIESWLKDPAAQVFYLAGLAGTGKTTIAKAVSRLVKGQTLFGAYTGKAASVLRKKGNNAATLHSLIYKLVEPDEEELKDLREKMANAGGKELEELRKEYKEKARPQFELNEESQLNNCELVICDEVSMVDEELGTDLKSFGKKILVLGDPAQLPPVQGEGYFTKGTPDFMLTEIHRQAQGNPIIQMAHKVRQGGRLKIGAYGESKVVPRYQPTEDFYDMQNICGRNATRKLLNDKIRDRRGFHGTVPLANELLICLRNNRQDGLLNGTQWYASSVQDEGSTVEMTLVDPEYWGDDAHLAKEIYLMETEERYRSRTVKVVSAHAFDLDLQYLSSYYRRSHNEFDFGYAITCHKSQGSQWPEVYISDESWCFRENSNKWLYTALTRAENKVVVQL